jgi:hypothetical protein
MEGYVLRNLQRGHTAAETWCECWVIQIDEDKSHAIYFPHRLRPPEVNLALKGWNVSFVNRAKYDGVIVDKRITWRLHIEVTEAEAFKTFIRIYSLLKSDRLSPTLHKALIISVINYVFPAWELAADVYLLKLQRLQKRFLRTTGNFPT